MKYKAFVEDNFLIDDAKTGKLVPFIFNNVQNKYYDILCKKYDIEKKGIASPIREIILKARREGFSSLILAIFAADDLLQENPTETLVMSYKDDATGTFRKRYRRFILSFYAKQEGLVLDENSVNTIESLAKKYLSIDANDIELKDNKAHFYCGTASARTGGRGGVLQKILFSEGAHYPDTENMTAKEIIEGTSQQVDKASGWIFIESTANGLGNYYEITYHLAKQSLSRFISRFFGWRDFYSPEQFDIIASEFTDKDMLKQEYPETDEEAFLASGLNYTTGEELEAMIGIDADKEILGWISLHGTNYIDQCEIIKSSILTFMEANKHYWLYIGIDVAKDVDKTIVTFLREKDVTFAGGVKAIAIDSTGAGDFMPDWFKRNSRWYIHEVKFSRQQKDIMYKNLRVVIKDRLTKLPIIKISGQFANDETRDFWKEMLDLQKEIIGNMLVVSHPSGKNYHDDYPDSWALAEWAYSIIKGAPKSRSPDKEGKYVNNQLQRLLVKQNENSTGENPDEFE